MEILTRTVAGLKVGSARTYGGLTIFPIFGSHGSAPDYLTLDEAVAAGTAHITEVGEGGSVPELRFVNDGDRPVLLLDGEELVGAKQNRVLNLTLMVPAGKTVVIPVSCVEAGRWAPVSREFRTAGHVLHSDSRRRKVAQVSFSLSHNGTPRAQQDRVWDDVASLFELHQVESPTSRLADVFRARGRDLSRYVAAFPAVDGQAGAVFALAGRIRGVEVFDHPRTLSKLFPKLIRSWAMDAMVLAEGKWEEPPVQAVRDFLSEVGSAKVAVHASPGAGEAVRLAGRRLSGAALAVEDHVVHLCAFRTEDGDMDRPDNPAGPVGRIVPASRRRRR